MAAPTRDRILDAARALIGEDGEATFSIEELTAASGVSNGSLYHHFGARDAVVAELVVAALADYQDGLIAVLETAPDAHAAVLQGVAHHLRWMEEHATQSRFIDRYRDAVAAGPSRELLRDRNRIFLRAVRAWLAAAIARGEIPDVDAGLVHAVVFAPAHEAGTLWLSGRERRRPTTRADALGRAAWSGLLALAAGAGAGEEDDRAAGGDVPS
jgi:AcrR family transcriptional regulator